MKRIAVKLILFVVLGAVVNVGVAWGCAMRETTQELWSLSCFVASLEAAADAGRANGDFSHARSRSVWQEEQLGTTHIVAFDGRHRTRALLLIGWPARALNTTNRFPRQTRAFDSAMESPRDGLEQSREFPPPLPLRPVVPGFAINTLFYAAIFWALWSAPFAAWRIVRRRRGRCVRCGYDLRHAEHEACPECGGRR